MDLLDYQLRILEKQTLECSDVEELLGDYVDGDLTPSLRTRVLGHICGCEECRELEETYRMTVELAAEIKPQPVPADVSRRLREALNARLGLSLA